LHVDVGQVAGAVGQVQFQLIGHRIEKRGESRHAHAQAAQLSPVLTGGNITGVGRGVQLDTPEENVIAAQQQGFQGNGSLRAFSDLRADLLPGFFRLFLR
jgi:hypothetical protein